MTLAYDSELMCIALASIADTADALLRNHAAELAEREVQNLVDIRTGARSLLKEMTNEETKKRAALKKLLVIGLCALLGCSESPVDENGRHIAEKSGNSFVVRTSKGGGEWSFTYVVVDGHEYLMMSGGPHRSGLTHSPKCGCLKSLGAEIVIPYVTITNSVPNLILEPTPVPL